MYTTWSYHPVGRYILLLLLLLSSLYTWNTIIPNIPWKLLYIYIYVCVALFRLFLQPLTWWMSTCCFPLLLSVNENYSLRYRLVPGRYWLLFVVVVVVVAEYVYTPNVQKYTQGKYACMSCRVVLFRFVLLLSSSLAHSHERVLLSLVITGTPSPTATDVGWCCCCSRPSGFAAESLRRRPPGSLQPRRSKHVHAGVHLFSRKHIHDGREDQSMLLIVSERRFVKFLF